MIFNTRTDAPLGSAPEADSGDNRDAFALATGATEGLVDAVDRIRANAELSDLGKASAIAKEQAARQPKLDRAAQLVKREGVAIDVLVNEQRKAAGLVAPAADSASAVRAQEIRAVYATLSPSDKLAALHGNDPEVLRALFFAPGIGPALLDERSRAVIEEKLLGTTDPARHAAIAIRKADHARASYALESATSFVNRKRL